MGPAAALVVGLAAVGSTAISLPARPRAPTAAARAAAPAWVRVRVAGGEAVVETATRTYVRGERRVDLVGLVHVGTAAYFADAARAADGGAAVFYESVVDGALVDAAHRLRSPIAATAAARRVAASCGLKAQTDALGGAAHAGGWTIADLTAAEVGAPVTAPGGVDDALAVVLDPRSASPRPERRFGAAAARALCALAPAPELALAALDWRARPPTVGGDVETNHRVRCTWSIFKVL